MKQENVIYAYSILEEDVEIRLWVVPVCPFCRKEHTHGAGSYADNPYTLLGGRGAHCEGSAIRSYILVDGEPLRTKRILGNKHNTNIKKFLKEYNIESNDKILFSSLFNKYKEVYKNDFYSKQVFVRLLKEYNIHTKRGGKNKTFIFGLSFKADTSLTTNTTNAIKQAS